MVMRVMLVYVLIKIAPGKEEETFKKISENEKIKKATEVLGPYDVVIEAEVEDEKELEDIVIKYLRGIESVLETVTLISVRKVS